MESRAQLQEFRCNYHYERNISVCGFVEPFHLGGRNKEEDSPYVVNQKINLSSKSIETLRQFDLVQVANPVDYSPVIIINENSIVLRDGSFLDFEQNQSPEAIIEEFYRLSNRYEFPEEILLAATWTELEGDVVKK